MRQIHYAEDMARAACWSEETGTDTSRLALEHDDTALCEIARVLAEVQS
jgi:hypothetical protein